MKPYQSANRGCFGRRVLLKCLLVGVVVTGCLTSPLLAEKKDKKAPPQPSTGLVTLGNDPLTVSGFDHFYNMEYDKAIHDFTLAFQQHPDDPFAANHLLSGYVFRELYRIGALDTELYAKNDFLDKKQSGVPLDPEIQTKIKQLAQTALALSETQLQSNPNDVRALYARGVTRGLKSTYMALGEKAWFPALRSVIGARHDHERVLELDPDFADAKTLVGAHNYVVGSLSWAVKVAASIIGMSGSKSKGMQYLKEAADAGGESSVDAKIAMALFFRREQRYDEAIQVVHGLATTYPRNFLFGLEEANLLMAAGHGSESVATFHKLLANGKAGLYTEAHLEQAAYGLGEALRGQHDFQGAAEAYDSVLSYKRPDPELQQRAYIGAGEMYDVLQKRDVAVKKYEAAISIASNTPRADLARKRLKEAYRTP